MASGIRNAANCSFVAQQVGLEYHEIKTQQDVKRDLGSAGCQENTDGMRRIGVSIGQPHVQGEHRGLERESRSVMNPAATRMGR